MVIVEVPSNDIYSPWCSGYELWFATMSRDKCLDKMLVAGVVIGGVETVELVVGHSPKQLGRALLVGWIGGFLHRVMVYL